MVREATQEDRDYYLQGDLGFIYATGDVVAGHIGYNTKSGIFFVHSFESHGDAHVAAALIQRVRQEGRFLGFTKARFHTKHPNMALKLKRANIIEAISEHEL